MHGCFLFDSPVLNAPCVLFHNDVVAGLVNAVVEEVSNTALKTELFEASNLSENVVKDTSVLD